MGISAGRKLVSDLEAILAERASVLRKRAALLAEAVKITEETGTLDLQLATLESESARVLAQIRGAKVDPTTGRKERTPPRGVIRPIKNDDLSRRAAQDIERMHLR